MSVSTIVSSSTKRIPAFIRLLLYRAQPRQPRDRSGGVDLTCKLCGQLLGRVVRLSRGAAQFVQELARCRYHLHELLLDICAVLTHVLGGPSSLLGSLAQILGTMAQFFRDKTLFLGRLTQLLGGLAQLLRVPSLGFRLL